MPKPQQNKKLKNIHILMQIRHIQTANSCKPILRTKKMSKITKPKKCDIRKYNAKLQVKLVYFK
ncbi:hypothetical protein [Escherichia albertii]